MEVDTQIQNVQTGSRGTKRTAEEEHPVAESSKKVKTGESVRFSLYQALAECSTELKPEPLKRDRENCTVFVAGLPTEVTDGDLFKLFKDVRTSEFPRVVVLTSFSAEM
jgi:RNA recognition motif-containing protein